MSRSDRENADVAEEPTGVAAWTVFRPVATLMVVIAVTVFGYISYEQLPVNLMPELSYPTLTVRTEMRGAAPAEVEDNITRPLEEIVRTVEGVVEVTSVSRPGQSDIVLRFTWDTDMDFATQKIRERLELVPLPDEAQTPLLLRYDPALDPFMRIGVSGDASLAELRRIAELDVERALQKVEGVAMIKVRGGLEEVIRVELDPGRMAFLGVTADEISQRLRAENVNLAGGALAEGDVTYLVRTLNAFEDIEEIRDLVVAYPDRTPVHLEQIADVRRDFREREVITSVGDDDGVSESVIIEVYKEADANLVEVSDRVQAALGGTDEQLADRARTLGRERGGRVGARARLQAEGKAGLSARVPVPRSDIVRARLPAGVELDILDDQSIFIRRSIDEVASTAIWGGIFAVLVLFLFLRNFWTTVIIAVSIPVSVVAAFGALRVSGVTLNVMSLGGIALGIGMLVDNSIVVLESIFRCREEGDDVEPAALRGTREVAGAVTASTLTTIAVFFPIVFVEGVAGQIFGDLALSVVFALVASLAVAIFFVPMLASRRFDVGTGAEGFERLEWRILEPLSTPAGARADLRAWLSGLSEATGLSRLWRAVVTPVVLAVLLVQAVVVTLLEFVFARALVFVLAAAWYAVLTIVSAVRQVATLAVGWAFDLFDRGYASLSGTYPGLLRGALKTRWIVVTAAAVLFGWSVWQFGQLGAELLPTMHQGVFNVEIDMPVGTRLEETAGVVSRLEQKLVGIPEVSRFATTVGVERDQAQSSDEGEHTARVTVRLEDAEEPELIERRAMEKVREAARALPGAQVEIRRPTLFALQTPLEVVIEGDDLRLLRRASDRVRDALGGMPELVDVRANLGRGFPEVQVRFNRDRLAAIGMTARDVGEAVRDQVRGTEPTSIRQEEEDVDIVVRTDPREIPDVESLEALIVRPRTGEMSEIRLGSVADLQMATGPSEIRHVEGRRAAVVTADVPLTSLSAAAAAVDRRLRRMDLPAGVSARVVGQSVELQRARESLLFALAVAIFLVYVVLASKFESFRGPFVILLSIPLALVGVVAALWALDIHVSVLVFIGLIMLTGIVVNNAIVLVDYVNQLRERGEGMEEAIVDASHIRLRPVLITTLTTVLGLLPMALGLGEGAELRTPMAVTVIAGLTSATILTLVVVPVLYRVLMASSD